MKIALFPERWTTCISVKRPVEKGSRHEKVKIERPNQVWSTDITYTAVDGHRAFVIGIVDWFSRKLLAYNVVNTMDAFPCVNLKIKEYVSLPQLHFGVQHCVNFYNTQRLHSALLCRMPDEVYFGICNSAARGYSDKAFTPIF